MTDILQSVQSRTVRFRPQSARELYALRLAARLSDLANLRQYLALANTYSLDALTEAYWRTLRASGPSTGAFERFAASISASLSDKEDYDSDEAAGGTN